MILTLGKQQENIWRAQKAKNYVWDLIYCVGPNRVLTGEKVGKIMKLCSFGFHIHIYKHTHTSHTHVCSIFP